ncbi:MAG: endonuclease/exonuclease/phosphatase family protein [Bacteroidales bacterium]|jgi:endonuclease/exonuclease/phosphatase family metal-dependent hydrolase|nr:endonuclease/exonuclease/phosphatase family protein [Bacteroidales bacterium]
MKKIVKYIILFFNFVAVFTLLGAFLAPMINPEKLPSLAFFGLIMPYSLIINVFFIIFWILKARYYFVLSLLAIALSWTTTKTSFPYHHSEKIIGQAGIKVLSYNVRVFDRYNWSKEKNTVSDMIRFIKAQKADVICLQEFGTSKMGKDGITETFILNALREYRYHYIHYAPNSLSKRHQQGLAILSKYPIEDRGIKGDVNLRKGCTIYADIALKTDKLRIINSHFESIHFTDKYDIIEGIDGENYKNRIKGAVRSINQAAIQHSESAKELTSIVNKSAYPVILCADMNNTPVSYSYHTLSNRLEDAFLPQGTGFGATYNGQYPFLRIDYIFHTSALPLIEYKRLKVRYSDHFPITAEFAIGP